MICTVESFSRQLSKNFNDQVGIAIYYYDFLYTFKIIGILRIIIFMDFFNLDRLNKMKKRKK